MVREKSIIHKVMTLRRGPRADESEDLQVMSPKNHTALASK